MLVTYEHIWYMLISETLLWMGQGGGASSYHDDKHKCECSVVEMELGPGPRKLKIKGPSISNPTASTSMEWRSEL